MAEVDVTKSWNPMNKVPLHEWLLDSQTPQDKLRLGCMGNIVVPLQARQAGRVLSSVQPLLC